MRLNTEELNHVCDMATKSVGWLALQKWCSLEIDELTNQLIENENSEVRGKIKGLKNLLAKVNSIKEKKYASQQSGQSEEAGNDSGV